MRDLSSVVELLENECADERMMAKLVQIKCDIAYTAPEMMYIRWNQVSEVLQEYYEEFHKYFWFQKILSIFSTQPIEEVSRICNAE